MRKKLLLVLALVISIILVVVMIFGFLGSKKKDNEPIQETSTNQTIEEVEVEESLQFITATSNGIINLYDTNSDEVIDTFDLKSFTEFTEDKIVKPTDILPKEEPIEEPIEEPEPEPKEDNLIERFKEFIKTKVIVKKGDSSWKIQQSLTPNRNISEMLKLVKEVNGGKPLHPIYPGEERIFLREDDGAIEENTSNVEQEPIEVEEVEETEEIEEVEDVEEIQDITEPMRVTNTKHIELDDSTVFYYVKSDDLKALYAYNDTTKSFYKIAVSDDKINATVLVTDFDLANIKDYRIDDENVYILTDEDNKITYLTISKPSTRDEYVLEGNLDVWTIDDGYLYYTYSDRLGKFDFADQSQIDIDLGDKSIDIFIKDNKLYVLNNFGSKLDNSVLFKINPNDLKADDLIKLNNNENVIISKNNDGYIYVGQIHKRTSLEKEEIRTPVLAPISIVNLKEENKIKPFEYTEETMGVFDRIFVMDEDIINIYDTKGHLIKNMTVNGDIFMIVQ